MTRTLWLWFVTLVGVGGYGSTAYAVGAVACDFESGIPGIAPRGRLQQPIQRLLQPGSFSSARFRPAPGTRCRPVASTPPGPADSNSRRPEWIRLRDIPAASDTHVTPPRPSDRASTAAHSRLRRSFSIGPMT